MPNTEKTFALKIINDLEKAITTFPFANSFDILPLAWNDYNLSPVSEMRNSIALELWAVKIVVPYAHRKLLENKLEKPVDLDILRPCILTLNLLHPEMPTAWNTRRELVVSKKLSPENDMQLTKLVLSRVPTCNEPLSYRRWLLRNNLIKGEINNLLSTELTVIQKAADKHHCNFHAWSHWSWCLNHFCPLDISDSVPGRNEATLISYKDFKLLFETSKFDFFYEKLKANTTFVCKHVSDYSSIFQRIHLIEHILKIVDNAVINFEDNLNGDDPEIDEFVDAVHDVNLETNDSDEEKTVFDLYKHLEQPILEILRFCDDESIKKYVSQNKINIKLGLILKELKWNEKLIKVFENIEAMLYYRRFLILSFKNVLYVQPSSLKAVVNKFYQDVISFENKFVELLVKDNLKYHKRIVNNYNSWLKKIIFKDDCNPFD